jgi:hypothetical protein
VSGARHLQHHGRKAVADEVVDVASDPSALCKEHLLSELTPRCLELDHEAFLSSERATDNPSEQDRHDPDPEGDLHGILNHGHQYRRRRGEPTQPRRGRERRRPTRGREGEQTGIEHGRLELSSALRNDHRDDDRDRDGGERHVPREGPEAPGGDRHHREGEIHCGRRLRDRREKRKRERKERKNTAKAIGFEPTPSGPFSHISTVLR